MVKPFIENQAAQAAACDLLDAMGNAKRLQVLIILSGAEMPVGQLASMVNLTQSALSQHLSKLKKVGLVSNRRDAQTIYYTCRSKAVLSVLDTLAALYSPTKNETKVA